MQAPNITLDGHTYAVSADDDSVLDVLQRNGVDVQAHCKNGYCGSCRTQCTKGAVEYHIDPLAYIESNEILPCSCLPIGNIELTSEIAIS
jgi:ferredoxin